VAISQADVTLLVAIYGALLSTLLALMQIRKERRQVRVTSNIALGTRFKGDVCEFLAITAVNVGHRPVTLVAAGLYMTKGLQFTQIESKAGPPSLPKKLNDGEQVSIYFDLPEMEKALKQQKPGVLFTSAFVRDAEGNTYKCGLPDIMKDRKLAG